MKPEDFKFCPKCKKELEKFDECFMCPNCNLKIYPHSSTTASVLLIEGDKILLTKRGIEPLKGQYDAIGGFLKYAEDPVKGVLREAEEETGLKIKIIHFLGIYMDSYGKDGESTLNLYYVGKIISGKIFPHDDVASLEWKSIDKLPKPAFKSQTRVFSDLKKWFLSRLEAKDIELLKPLAETLVSNWDYSKFPKELLDFVWLQSQVSQNPKYIL